MRMETKIWAVTILACITFFSACSNKSESEIESETSSGVVLIQNKSYYEVVLPNNKSFYFSSLDENNDIKGLDTDENTVERTISYGTGFFISDEGEIATNSHVVSSSISDKDINKSVSSLFGILKKYISREYDELRKKN